MVIQNRCRRFLEGNHFTYKLGTANLLPYPLGLASYFRWVNKRRFTTSRWVSHTFEQERPSVWGGGFRRLWHVCVTFHVFSHTVPSSKETQWLPCLLVLVGWHLVFYLSCFFFFRHKRCSWFRKKRRSGVLHIHVSAPNYKVAEHLPAVVCVQKLFTEHLFLRCYFWVRMWKTLAEENHTIHAFKRKLSLFVLKPFDEQKFKRTWTWVFAQIAVNVSKAGFNSNTISRVWVEDLSPAWALRLRLSVCSRRTPRVISSSPTALRSVSGFRPQATLAHHTAHQFAIFVLH